MAKSQLLTNSNYLQKNWLNLLFIVIVQLFVVLFYLNQLSLTTSLGVPLDDTYIHYQYAKNLARHNEFAFNHGESSVGTTSTLWAILLAIVYKLGNIVTISLVLGVLFSAISAISLFEISRSLFSNTKYPLFIALLFIICGNNIWFSLSGMEITMFLAFGLLSVLMYSKNKLFLSSLFSGLLSLTRPEGILLIALIFLYEVIKQYKNKWSLKRLLIILIVPSLLILPNLFHNLYVTGYLLPSTLSGRKWVAGLPEQISITPHTFWFPLMWPYRLVMWVFMLQHIGNYVSLAGATILIIVPIYLVLIGFIGYLSVIGKSVTSNLNAHSGLVILFFCFSSCKA